MPEGIKSVLLTARLTLVSPSYTFPFTISTGFSISVSKTTGTALEYATTVPPFISTAATYLPAANSFFIAEFFSTETVPASETLLLPKNSQSSPCTASADAYCLMIRLEPSSTSPATTTLTALAPALILSALIFTVGATGTAGIKTESSGMLSAS